MYSITPPATDLSRTQLKKLTRWIRDDLDPVVAREGPNALHPDDVLTLHETFLQLRRATYITAKDLHATGIHRAVQEVAGVATRWPSQLCDDCDGIIESWTGKFGPFNKLHPFLYGRGGRLEGIASAAEYSPETVLERWCKSCPEKLHAKQSHRLGNLGFRAGDWWINTLFAHHAGIIGLESIDGGTTFDKYGAYALVLKDAGEVEAISEDSFTYQVPRNDKGKFRLTAATRRSRYPIRVLRSHSIHSIWGPTAGVRYEGLYAVKGWTIRQAKTSEIAGGQWRKGDVLFQVRFERNDAVPVEEISKRPTATEVDDYSEYKRLRKIHREEKRKEPVLSEFSAKPDHTPVLRAAPIATKRHTVVPSSTPTPLRHNPSGLSHRSIFTHPHFDAPERQSDESPISPTTVPNTDQLPLVRSNRAVPIRSSLRLHQQLEDDDGRSGDVHGQTGPDAGLTHADVSMQADMREVAPWMDFDASFPLRRRTRPMDLS